MSYGNNTTVIDLQKPGTTLIAGPNGAGKTVLLNGLAFAVFGKPVSNISLDNLVNNINKKNMEVTVTFEKDNTYYLVQRVRKSKSYAAGNYVKFYAKEGSDDFTDDDEITLDNVAHTNAAIEDIVGIPHEIFCRIVVFSALHIPFLNLPIRHPTQACQTRIIEELFDLTTLTSKAKMLKQQISDKETSLEIKQSRIEQLEKEHGRHETQIQLTKNRVISWEQQNDQNIDSLKEKLKKIVGVNVSQQRKWHEQLITYDGEINTNVTDKRQLTTTLSRTTKDLTKKENELEHLSNQKCPYCLQKYQDADLKIQEINAEIETKRNKVHETEQSIKECDKKIKAITKRRDAIKRKITVPNLDELIEITSQSSSITSRITELEKSENPFIEPLEELESIILDPINSDEINTLVKLIEHQKFLYKLLTKKDSFVRKSLLNKNIPYLNGKLQQYLTELGLPHTVEFTRELTASISQFGHTLDFGNLSNGQQSRVNIALALAFRDVLQNIHVNINVYMFDEVLDVGLDAGGVQAAAHMLKQKARDEKLTLFIISHKDEIDNAFDHKMSVQMTDGFSFIEDT